MGIYRIKVSIQGKPRFGFTGIFLNAFEAAFQAAADYPDATGISVIRVGGAA